MAILTLTTDWGLRDHYLASFKGELLSLIPGIQLVDITHEIEKFNTMQAAYIVQNSFQKFPVGSIHFIGVSCNENCPTSNPYVIIRVQGQFLIGEDSGIFTLMLGQIEKEIIRLPITNGEGRHELLRLLVNTIKKLSEGVSIYELGIADNFIIESYFAQPTVDSHTIRGTVIYIDSFGNAIVNISRELFFNEMKERNFIIHLRKATYNVSSISQTYEDVEVGEMCALFNQDSMLEIALNKESASKLLGLKLMDPIRIEFDDIKAG